MSTLSRTLPPSFDEFQAQALAAGYETCLVRTWEPLQANADHQHPFDTHAWVVEGEFWLTLDGQERHLQVGDTFDVPRGVTHRERYGATGAVFWVARRER